MRVKFYSFIFGQMGKKSNITRAKLIETARELFHEKGFDGLKMQELADRAGMNKGLLHYYFKSKEALFQAIFKEAIINLFGGLTEVLVSKDSLEMKLHKIVDVYFEKLMVNPGLPVFVLSEMHKNPSMEGFPFASVNIPKLVNAIKQSTGLEIDQNKIFNLLLTIISLSVFPFAARPLLSQILDKEMGFEAFMEQRKIYIKNVVSQLIVEL